MLPTRHRVVRASNDLAAAAEDRAGRLSNLALLCGSVPGREHVRLGRNNQDAVAVRRGERYLIAAVADGCSAGTHSEVGAQLCCRWLASWIPTLLNDELDADTPRFGARLQLELARYLRHVLRGLTAEGYAPAIGHRDHARLHHLRELMLFGFLVAIVGHERFAIWGLGDGVHAVNGELIALDAGPANAPPYLAYQLVDASIGSPDVGLPVERLKLHASGETATLDSLLLATDGALDLISSRDGSWDDLIAHPRYVDNPSLLAKRLRVLSERGQLRDDTTIALLRRPSAPRRGAAGHGCERLQVQS